MPVLRTQDLTKIYGKRPAVEGLDLTIENRQIFGFLGPNGAGKTTTIKMLLGLVRPTRGGIHYFDNEQNRLDLLTRRRIGAIVESPAFLNYLSGRRHLKILARLYGGVVDREIDQLLDWVGLLNRADEPIHNYSLGMRQRLGLAQALLHKPDFLVLDEPTNGLDPQGIVDIRKLLLRLNRDQGITMLISSHLLGEVELLCTHVGFIHHGKLLDTGQIETFLDEKTGEVIIECDDPKRARDEAKKIPNTVIKSLRPSHLHVMMNGDHCAELAERLVQAGVRFREIVRKRKSLEEKFIELTTKDSA